MMTIEATQLVPLVVWDDGSIRIKDSRVTLDSILYEYNLGATAEQLADSFPAISLADIYAAIAYYLTHRAEIEAYLRQRETEADAIQSRIESDPNYQAFKAEMRARLLARAQALKEKSEQ